MDEDVILDFLGGRLPAGTLVEVEQHADQCSTCMELIVGAGAFERDLDLTGPSTGAPPVLGGRAVLDFLQNDYA